MRFPRSFASPLLLALLLAIPPSAHARDLLTRVLTPVPSGPFGQTATLSARPRAAMLEVDRAALDELRAAESGMLALPLPDGTSLTLVLERRELFAPGAQVTFTDANGPHPLTLDLAVFRGTVPGEPGTWASVTLTPEGVRATLSRGGERMLLMPSGLVAADGELALHVLSAEAEIETPATPWTCGVDGWNEAELEPGGPSRPGSRGPAQPNSTEIDAPRKIFALAVDCDQEITAVKFGGNLTAATNYITALLATVSLIYEKDVEVTLNVSYLNLWTTTDPYDQPDTGSQLPQFRSWWNANRSGIPRSLAHLISGRDLGGGIAYINQLCASTVNGFGYGVSGIDGAYAYPTNASTWDANVIAHELGHNFGSWHTHSCNWADLGYISPAGAQLDTCYTSEGGCNVAPTRLPPDKGTIMSYCHLITGGVTSNIRMDFHPVCVTRMREVVNFAPCSTNPVVAPPRNVSASAIPTGVRIAWTAGGTAGVLGYDVYRSKTQHDFNPSFLGATSGLFFDDTELGMHYYKVRAHRAADTSSFGSEVKLSLCPLTPQPELGAGPAPTAVAVGDFNGDGISDLVVAKQTSSLVSLLAGNGSGGIGDGTFAPAVTIATVPDGQCLLVTDTNGDGLSDLVVGSSADSSRWSFPGGGVAGVPDGTFGEGTRLPLGFIPTSIATADFNEDGRPDLAVAGSTSGLRLLFGGGSGGVPDGTYGAPVPVTFAATTRSVVVGDFNEDGIWDLAVTSNNFLRVLRGAGTNGIGDGTFQAPLQYNAGANAFELATGDFNLDGITDLVAVYSSVSGAGIFLGNGIGGVGNGTFPAGAAAITVGANARGPVVGDWNGDGVPDLAIVNSGTAKTLSVLTGKGNGTFNTALTWGVNTAPWAIALGDWNHDGGIDLAVANKGANTVTPLLCGCVNSQSIALAVTSPAGPDTLIETINRTLTWTRGPGVAQVDVQLSRDGGVTWATIARNRFDTAFTWTPTGPATTQARLRVVDTARGWVSAQSAANFTILPQSVLDAAPVAAPAFAILGSWPNPARGSARLAFTLPAAGRAKVGIYDLAGARVRTLHDGDLPAGPSALAWDGRDGRGAPVRAGAYFIRLEFAGRSLSRSMVMMN